MQINCQLRINWRYSKQTGIKCKDFYRYSIVFSLTNKRRVRYFYHSPGPYINKVMAKTKSQTFEAALAELESIVASMEAGQLPLEQSLAAYKRGAELLKYCQSALAEVQQQVRILEADTLKNLSGADDTNG